MTRAELIRENEALHGLLAHACQTLALLAGYTGDNLIAQHHADLALNTLAQIKEGVVP